MIPSSAILDDASDGLVDRPVIAKRGASRLGGLVSLLAALLIRARRASERRLKPLRLLAIATALIPTSGAAQHLDVKAPAVRQQFGPPTDRPLHGPKPAWHFFKTVTLPSFLGSNDLPYEGFRGCAPFACASLLYGRGYKLNKARLQELAELDPEKDGTPQAAVVSYLKRFFDLQESETSSIDELIARLDAGFPAWVVIRSEDKLHASLVTGYEVGSDSQVVSWTLVDNGVAGGCVAHDAFVEMWDCSDKGFNNYALFVRPRLDHRPLVLCFPKSVELPHLTIPKHVTIDHNSGGLVATVFQASGCDVSQPILDQILRELDPFRDGVRSDDLARYLDAYFNVEYRSKVTTEELAAHLDAGLPVFVVLETDDWLHWALVTGYRSDHLREPLAWTLLDANSGATELSQATFAAAWKPESSYENLALFLTPSADKPRPEFPLLTDLSATVRLPVTEVTPESWTSGPLAVAALLATLGHDVEPDQMCGLAALVDPQRDGTPATELERFLDKYFDVIAHVGIDPGQLKKGLDSGRAAILLLGEEDTCYWSVVSGYQTDRNGKFVAWDYVQNGRVYDGVAHGEFIASICPNTTAIFLAPAPESQRDAALSYLDLHILDASLQYETLKGLGLDRRSAPLSNARTGSESPDAAYVDGGSPYLASSGGENNRGSLFAVLNSFSFEKMAEFSLEHGLMLVAVAALTLVVGYLSRPGR